MGDERQDRNTLLKWGVRPLPKNEREGTREGVDAAPRPAAPTRPPAGGSAVPPAPAVKSGAGRAATGGDGD